MVSACDVQRGVSKFCVVTATRQFVDFGFRDAARAHTQTHTHTHTQFAGPFFTSQLSCSFTVHASMRRRRRPQEKCGLPSADCHGTLAVQQLHLQMYTERGPTQHLSVRGGFLTKIVTTQQSTCSSVITNCNPVSQEIWKLRAETYLHPNGSKTVNGTNCHTTHASHTTFSH